MKQETRNKKFKCEFAGDVKKLKDIQWTVFILVASIK